MGDDTRIWTCCMKTHPTPPAEDTLHMDLPHDPAAAPAPAPAARRGGGCGARGRSATRAALAARITPGQCTLGQHVRTVHTAAAAPVRIASAVRVQVRCRVLAAARPIPGASAPVAHARRTRGVPHAAQHRGLSLSEPQAAAHMGGAGRVAARMHCLPKVPVRGFATVRLSDRYPHGAQSVAAIPVTAPPGPRRCTLAHHLRCWRMHHLQCWRMLLPPTTDDRRSPVPVAARQGHSTARHSQNTPPCCYGRFFPGGTPSRPVLHGPYCTGWAPGIGEPG